MGKVEQGIERTVVKWKFMSTHRDVQIQLQPFATWEGGPTVARTPDFSREA